MLMTRSLFIVLALVPALSQIVEKQQEDGSNGETGAEQISTKSSTVSKRGLDSLLGYGYEIGGVGGQDGWKSERPLYKKGINIVKTVTLTKEIPVPVPVNKYIPFPVEKKIPVQIEKKIPVYVEKPVPYPVDRYVPVNKFITVHVEKKIPFPVTVEKKIPIPYPVKKLLYYPVEKKVPVPVPYPVTLEKKVPVPYPVEKPVPYAVHVQKKIPVVVTVEKPVPYPVEKKVPLYAHVVLSDNERQNPNHGGQELYRDDEERENAPRQQNFFQHWQVDGPERETSQSPPGHEDTGERNHNVREEYQGGDQTLFESLKKENYRKVNRRSSNGTNHPN